MAITVSSNIKKANDSIPFSAEDQEMKGGFRCVASIAERDAIPVGARRSGMVVRVVDVDATVDYTLPYDNLSNAAWVVVETASRFKTPVKLITETEYTLTLEDVNCWLRTKSDLPVTITVPDLAWPATSHIHFEQGAEGSVTIVAGAGVTVTTSARHTNVIDGKYSPATLKLTSANVWALFGNLYAGEPVPSGLRKYVLVDAPYVAGNFKVTLPAHHSTDVVYHVKNTEYNGFDTLDVDLSVIEASEISEGYEIVVVNGTVAKIDIGSLNSSAIDRISEGNFIESFGYAVLKYDGIDPATSNPKWTMWGTLVSLQ